MNDHWVGLEDKAMLFHPNTFFSTWTPICQFSYHTFQGTASFLAFIHHFFFLVLPESLFGLGPHFNEVISYSTCRAAPLHSGEATLAPVLLLMLPSGSPLMSADCFGGHFGKVSPFTAVSAWSARLRFNSTV